VYVHLPSIANHWCRRRGAEGESAIPRRLIWWKSWRNRLKSGQNLWKFGQNVWIPSQNRCMYFDFTKMAPKIKMQTSFFVVFFCFWGSCFYLIRLGQVWGKFGQKWCLKYIDLKKCAQHKKKCSRIFGGYFLWSIFRAGLGKYGQKYFTTPKICLLLHLCRQQPEKDKQNIFAPTWKNFCGRPW